mgnify:CR=1 FL=1
MELYKYPGIRQCTYNELDEFVRRLFEPTPQLARYISPYRVAGVYHEMGTEQVSMEGVSAEGSSWAMEGTHAGNDRS